MYSGRHCTRSQDRTYRAGSLVVLRNLAVTLDPQHPDGPLNDMECKAPVQTKLKELGISTRDVQKAMTMAEIHDDVKILVAQMAAL